MKTEDSKKNKNTLTDKDINFIKAKLNQKLYFKWYYLFLILLAGLGILLIVTIIIYFSWNNNNIETEITNYLIQKNINISEYENWKTNNL